MVGSSSVLRSSRVFQTVVLDTAFEMTRVLTRQSPTLKRGGPFVTLRVGASCLKQEHEVSYCKALFASLSLLK